MCLLSTVYSAPPVQRFTGKKLHVLCIFFTPSVYCKGGAQTDAHHEMLERRLVKRLCCIIRNANEKKAAVHNVSLRCTFGAKEGLRRCALQLVLRVKRYRVDQKNIFEPNTPFFMCTSSPFHSPVPPYHFVHPMPMHLLCTFGARETVFSVEAAIHHRFVHLLYTFGVSQRYGVQSRFHSKGAVGYRRQCTKGAKTNRGLLGMEKMQFLRCTIFDQSNGGSTAKEKRYGAVLFHSSKR